MEKILVLGSSGSGKSTFARQLGQALNIKVLHLDSHYWLPDWTETTPEAWEKKLGNLLLQDQWVMDGNYTSSLEKRLSYADTAIFLDISRTVCLTRCFRRLAQNWGRSRQELAPGCYEKMDWEFFQWIWTYSRKRKPVILKMLNQQQAEVQIILLKREQIANFLAEQRMDVC